MEGTVRGISSKHTKITKTEIAAMARENQRDWFSVSGPQFPFL